MQPRNPPIESPPKPRFPPDPDWTPDVKEPEPDSPPDEKRDPNPDENRNPPKRAGQDQKSSDAAAKAKPPRDTDDKPRSDADGDENLPDTHTREEVEKIRPNLKR
jgi:hypothetical protein